MENIVRETVCKSALYRHNSKWLPYKYDINVYRGCAHRCIYCYALYSHAYIGGGNFHREIYAKTNIAAVLAGELRRFSGETVNLGGVTDSYQPAEREYKLTRAVLELLAAYRVPVTVCTKSPLILRDIGLLMQAADAGGAKAAFTITTLDDTVARLIEPGAPPPRARMDAVRTLRQGGIACGVHLMPVIPYLTSDAHDLEAVFDAAKEADASYVLAGALNLKGETRPVFMDNVHTAFPALYGRVRALYRDKSSYQAYKEDLHRMLEKLRKKYRLPYYTQMRRQPQPQPEPEQLSFWNA